MIHVWSSFETRNLGTLQRQRVAQATWALQPWTECPVKDSDLPRLFKDESGSVPYIADLINFAAKLVDDHGIIVLTNADICVRSDCAVTVAARMQDMECLYSYRMDFDQPFSAPKRDSEIPRGRHYVGTDFFAFRKRWWQSIEQAWPEMLLGREAWDAILRTMMDRTYPKNDVHVPYLCYHHKHESIWENPANRWRIPSQLHCIKLAKKWCQRHAVNHRAWGLPA